MSPDPLMPVLERCCEWTGRARKDRARLAERACSSAQRPDPTSPSTAAIVCEHGRSAWPNAQQWSRVFSVSIPCHGAHRPAGGRLSAQSDQTILTLFEVSASNREPSGLTWTRTKYVPLRRSVMSKAPEPTPCPYVSARRRPRGSKRLRPAARRPELQTARGQVRIRNGEVEGIGVHEDTMTACR